jgi:hypothetical protein
MILAARLIATLLSFFVFCEANEQSSHRALHAQDQATAEEEIRDRTNSGTIGLAADLLKRAPIHFAAEIALIVNDDSDMHVLPIVTRGRTENVNDLLYLRGVNAAIINVDSLEEYKSQIPNIQQQLAYILSLFLSELHIFVRPEIHTLADLAGKKVNFNSQGTAAAYSDPLIFSRLGIEVDKELIPYPLAPDEMRRGEIAAVVFITSEPVDVFVKGKWDEGFKFLRVDYDQEFQDYYLPAHPDPCDYPNMIGPDQPIATISVPALLATLCWDSPRDKRTAKFVDALLARIDRLKSPGFDPKWKDVDLATRAPGLDRFRASQTLLDRSAERQGANR